MKQLGTVRRHRKSGGEELSPEVRKCGIALSLLDLSRAPAIIVTVSACAALMPTSQLAMTAMVVGSLLVLAGGLFWNRRPAAQRLLSLVRAGSAVAVLLGAGLYLRGLRGFMQSREPRPPVQVTETLARLVLPDAVRLERRDPATVAGYSKGPDGAETVEYAVRGKGDGYAPGVVVAVAVSSAKKILRVRVVRQAETPSFMEIFREGKLLEGLAGRSIDDELVIGKDLDAVSGATLTSEGVAAAVRDAVKSPALGVAMQPPPTLLTVPDQKSLAACAYLLLVALFLKRLRGKIRLVCLGLSLTVMGSMFGRLFSVSDFARTSTGLLPAGNAGAGTLLFLLVLGAVTVWRGRMWCSHVCPLGAMCELGAKLTRARTHTPKTLPWLPKLLPWITVAAVAIIIAASGNTEAASAEPFGIAAQLLSWPPNALGLWRNSRVPLMLFAGVLLFSMVSMRFYCRNLCGAGLLLSILTRLRALGRKPAGEDSGTASSITDRH